MRIEIGLFVALVLGSRAMGGSPWVVQPSGTTERLRGVSVVDDRVVWATGNHGTCIRSVDGGASWRPLLAPDAAGLDFRDVEAFDAERAFVLAIGPGEASRIFKATHGGTALVECYRNRDPKGFLDAVAFWDHDHGLALGDPVDGRFVILKTDDGGRVWEQTSDPGTMPVALPNEGAFAASGTCLIVGTGGHAWFATGGASKARVFHSTDLGRSWTVAETPVRVGEPTRGIFGLGFRDAGSGIAVGGDYKQVDQKLSTTSSTRDGGRTWWIDPERPEISLFPRGFRSAVAFLPHQPDASFLAIGPSGTDLATDDGHRWRALADAEGWHALGVTPSGRFAWAVGEGGRIGRLNVADSINAP